MPKDNTVLILAAVCLLLLALVISSFIRHLRWEERLFKWRIRIFFHTVFFLVALLGLGYLYFVAGPGKH